MFTFLITSTAETGRPTLMLDGANDVVCPKDIFYMFFYFYIYSGCEVFPVECLVIGTKRMPLK